VAQAPRRDYDRYEKPTNKRKNERTNEPNSTIDPFGKFLRSSNTGNSRSSGSKQAGAMTRFSLSTGISPYYHHYHSLSLSTNLTSLPTHILLSYIRWWRKKEKKENQRGKKRERLLIFSALAFKSLSQRS